MKSEEFKAKYGGRVRKKPSDKEHRLQCQCVAWFRATYPGLRDVLIAVPNGGRRDAVTGAKLKEEGAMPGAADLLLLKPNKFHGCLAIEMKTAKGRQQDTQKKWQASVEAVGNKYVVCRSLDEFVETVNDYLNDV